MPLTYRIDGPILEITTDGSTSVDEYRQVLTTALEDPRVPPRPLLLSDSALATGDVSADEVAAMARITLSVRNRIAPFKAVVATRSLIHGLARMYGRRVDMDGDGIECQVFTTAGDAREWLLSKLPAQG